MSPIEKEALLEALRVKNRTDTTAQEAAHQLINLIVIPSPADLERMHETKEELEDIIIAIRDLSVMAAEVGKVISAQIQFTKTGRIELRKECYQVMKKTVKAFEREVAVQKICTVQFFMRHPVSTDKAHQLESYAQQYCIRMASDDSEGTICQFYSAAAVSGRGMSVLNVEGIIGESPRVVVVTITLYEADPLRLVEPWDARNDSVFGPNPTAVCCAVRHCMHVYEHPVLFLICDQPGADISAQSHAFDGHRKYHPRDPEGRPRRPHCR